MVENSNCELSELLKKKRWSKLPCVGVASLALALHLLLVASVCEGSEPWKNHSLLVPSTHSACCVRWCQVACNGLTSTHGSRAEGESRSASRAALGINGLVLKYHCHCYCYWLAAADARSCQKRERGTQPSSGQTVICRFGAVTHVYTNKHLLSQRSCLEFWKSSALVRKVEVTSQRRENVLLPVKSFDFWSISGATQAQKCNYK